jgi:hypothetical protein
MGANREYEKILESFIKQLRSMEDKRALEQGQAENMIAKTKRLRHALRVRNLREVEAAISNLARTFLIE